jgi:hypothetical protein
VATPDSSDAASPDYFATALLNLRDTVKWMMAAASVVAGVLVAGLQVKNVGNLTPTLRAVGAMLAAAVALLLVLAVIAAAARVLTVPRLSVRDLSGRELKAGGSAAGPRLEPLPDDLVQRLLERRTYLLGQHDTIGGFYNDYRDILSGRDKLSRGQFVCLFGRDFDPSKEEDRNALASLALQVQASAERLETAAQLTEAEMRFQRLANQLWFGGIVFAAAVLAFSWLVSTNPTSASVTQPTPVLIYVQAAAKAGLSRDCHAKTLQGVAIGGTFTQPSVVTEPAPGCPSTLIKTDTGVVIVPVVKGNP